MCACVVSHRHLRSSVGTESATTRVFCHIAASMLAKHASECAMHPFISPLPNMTERIRCVCDNVAGAPQTHLDHSRPHDTTNYINIRINFFSLCFAFVTTGTRALCLLWADVCVCVWPVALVGPGLVDLWALGTQRQ